MGEVDDNVAIVDDLGQAVLQHEGGARHAGDIDAAPERGWVAISNKMGDDEGGIGCGELKDGPPHPAGRARNDKLIIEPSLHEQPPL